MSRPLPLFPEADPPTDPDPLAGFRLMEDVVSSDAQADFVAIAQNLPFAPFDFRGFKGARRTVSFGSRYDFSRSRIEAADAMPEWLRPLRAAAAAFAGVPDTDLVQALITEYPPGAGIGWHRDRPEYGRIVGLSFASDCILRFRRPKAGGWRRRSIPLRPGSVYLLDGPARHAWQHSISPGVQLRYSITFRTLRPPS